MNKPNKEIIQDIFEQIVNQKKIELWDQYFSPNYVAHSAPTIGLGFYRDTSEKKHLIHGVFPGSPADGKLQVGDEVLWVKDERQRCDSFEEIQQVFSKGYQGKTIRLGFSRDGETLEFELAKDYFEGFETPTGQAKSEMRAFMDQSFPDLKAEIKLMLADGEMVVTLVEYRGTHAKFKREAVWREAWFARLAEGQVIESWPITDESSFFRHLGFQLIPPNTAEA